MTTFAPLRHRGSSFLHRHRSGSISRVNSPTEPAKPTIFEGTDAVTQNRKVAVQRIVEAHYALELQKIEEEGGITRRSASSGSTTSSTSTDVLNLQFKVIDIPNGEVRAFRYFLRMWDHDETPDPEFDRAIKPAPGIDFEAETIRHFFQRIALWHESEEVLKALRKEKAKRLKRENKKYKDNALGMRWVKERETREDDMHNPLKEVTTREGLAQLLWTLMHDQDAPLAPALFAECKEAVKRKYGIASVKPCSAE